MLETFEYRARDRNGEAKTGTLEAESRQAVLEHLRELGYLPVAVTSKKPPPLKRQIRLPFTRKVKLAEIAVFSRQFSTMIEAGITVMRALAILQSQSENPALVATVTEMRAQIAAGSSLSDAVASFPKIFDRLFLAMVRAGEASGTLDVILRRVSDSLEQRVELQRKIKSALTYPIAVLVLVVVILTAMLIFVVPTFKSIFASLGGQLPLPTRILLEVSHLAVEFFPVLLLLYAGIAFGFVKMRRSKKGKAILDRMSLRIPVFGTLIHKYALARFSGSLATLIRSGVNLVPALDIASQVANNSILKEAILDTRDGISQGEAIAGRLGRHPIFPPMVTQMVAIGEESGSLDTLLEKIAAFYHQEVSAMTESLASLLEPLLIVVLGAVVGSMVIALYLPMFDVIKLLK